MACVFEDDILQEDNRTIDPDDLAKLFANVNRKWHYYDGKDITTALEKCLCLCGTWLDGSVKDCDGNFLHCVPFALLNETTVTNLFLRDDPEHSELFLLIVNAIEAVWRPDPQQSVEQDVYPQSENPSPVLAVLNRIYAMHSTGNVNFFVQTNKDLSSLAEPLQISLESLRS